MVEGDEDESDERDSEAPQASPADARSGPVRPDGGASSGEPAADAPANLPVGPRTKRDGVGELEEVAAELAVHLLQQMGWSGALPHPDDFYRYTSEHQERMLRWVDSHTVDESARQNKLVDAEIDYGRRGQRAAIGLSAASLAGAFALACLGNNVGAAILFGITLVALISKFVGSARSDDSGP